MKLIDEEVEEKAKEFEEEMAIDYEDDCSDEDLIKQKEKNNNLDENIEAINRRAERYHDEVQQFFETHLSEDMDHNYR